MVLGRKENRRRQITTYLRTGSVMLIASPMLVLGIFYLAVVAAGVGDAVARGEILLAFATAIVGLPIIGLLWTSIYWVRVVSFDG